MNSSAPSQPLRLAALLALVLLAGPLLAQTPALHLREDYTLDTLHTGDLRFHLRNADFFHNNEYAGHLADGYTLPGFRIRPTVSYQPLPNLKLDLGVYLLRYWGTDQYPNICYSNMPDWQGDHNQKGFHILPFLRAQVTLRNFHIILGSIYGAVNHQLAEPIYNPEMVLSGDPETGMQFIWENRYIWADTWINWETFIFDNDYHQESFTYGLSVRLRANRPESHTHLYFPIQLLMQHRGGEINTEAEDRTVKTWMNAATGVGLTFHTSNPVLTRVNIEAMAACYRQQAGSAFAFDDGYGAFAKATLDVGPCQVSMAYWLSKDFVTIHGNPLYGSVSIKDEDYVVDGNSMLRLHAHYAKKLAKGISLGMGADAYVSLPTDAYTPDEGWHSEGRHVSYSFGVYLYIDTDILIKKLRSL